VVCDRTAIFGIPEVLLGKSAPLAHGTLYARYPGREATRHLLTGHTLSAQEATQLGLADDCSDAPESALQAWFERALASPTAASLRFALRAARGPVQWPLATTLEGVQAEYIEALMAFRHPEIGLTPIIARADLHGAQP
jgi:cyclohexa-1,5-dienecarbonyl-CoA hydratase